MNKIPFAIAVIAAATIIAPKIVSTQVTQSLENVVERVNDFPGYQASIQSIDEGWFSSSAKINLSLNPAAFSQDNEIALDAFQAVLHFESAHGPVFFKDKLGMGWVDWKITSNTESIRNKLEWPENEPFYQLSYVTGILGTSSIDDSITAFSYMQPEDNVEVQFSGYQGSGTYSNSVLDYSGQIAQVTVNSKEANFTMGKTRFDLAMQGDFLKALEGEFNPSQVEIEVSSVAVRDNLNSETMFDLESLLITVDSALNEQQTLVSMHQNMAISRMNMQGYEMSDLKLNVEVNNLSAQFLRDYQKITKELAGTDQSLAQQQLALFAEQNMLSLLTPEPQLNITALSGTLPEGDFTGTLNSAIVGVTDLPAIADDPAFWIAHINADAKIKMDKEVLQLLVIKYFEAQLAANPQTAEMEPEQITQIAQQQAPIFVETLLQQQVVIDENGKITSAFTLKDGQAILNTNPVPLPY